MTGGGAIPNVTWWDSLRVLDLFSRFGFVSDFLTVLPRLLSQQVFFGTFFMSYSSCWSRLLYLFWIWHSDVLYYAVHGFIKKHEIYTAQRIFFLIASEHMIRQSCPHIALVVDPRLYTMLP